MHQSDWQNEGVPFYRTREIVKLAETGTVENNLFISNELFHKLSIGGLPHASDLMITAVGTIGKVYIVREEDRFYFKDASVISFRNYGDLEPYFLKSLISSSCVQNQIFSKSAGTTVDTITIVKANDYLLPIPPIEEQKRISKALTQREQQLIAILNSRKRYRRILTETPTSLRQQLIQAAIQGQLVPQNPNDEPASILLERIAQERTAKLGKKAVKSMSRIERRGSKTYELFPDGSEKDISEDIPFEIPSSWEWCRIGAIFTLQAGKFISSASISEKSDKSPYPCYGGNGFRGYVGIFNRDGDYPLIGRQGALCGNINRATGKFYATEHAVCVESYYCVNVDWLCLFLRALNLNRYATATAQPGLAVSTLNEVLFPLPPQEEQNRIAKTIRLLSASVPL